MLYITGDTHGDLDALLRRVEKHGVSSGDMLIICGDFGFVFTDKQKTAFDEIKQFPFDIAFVDGNHENFTEIYKFPVERWNGGTVHRLAENIVHLMRGQRYEINGSSFFTFGGAYSRDSDRRILGKTLWSEEIPTEEEYATGWATLEQCNYKVDYILTHTAPYSAIDRMGFEHDEADRRLTEFLEEVLQRVSFKEWYFGHFHCHDDIDDKLHGLYFKMVEIV